jgi:hypothetical protein
MQECGVAWNHRVTVELSRATTSIGPSGSSFVAEAALKIVLNAVTTGGHIFKGKVGSRCDVSSALTQRCR